MESAAVVRLPDEVKSGIGALSEEELARVREPKAVIARYYREIPIALRDAHQEQERCLSYVLPAEQDLNPPITRAGMITSRPNLTRVEIEFGRVRNSKLSFLIVATVFCLFAIAAAGGYWLSRQQAGIDLANARLIGIATPIIVWSVMGCLTSMLLAAGQLPFAIRQEPLRWLLCTDGAAD